MPYYRANGAGAVIAPEIPSEPDDTDASGGLRIGGLTSSVRARLNVPFSLEPTVQGAAAASWSLVGSSLPAWASLDVASGRISGTPSGVEAVEGLRLRAEAPGTGFGLSRTFVLDVKPQPSVAMASATYAFEAGRSAVITPQASDVYGSASWTLSGGRLPFGLVINPTSGAISGTPEQEGAFSGLRLNVIDADGAVGMSPAFSIAVTSALKITGLQPNYQMRAGLPFSMTQPVATGGAGAIGWSLADGVLPDGVSIDPASGAISGVPTAIGSGEFRIRATDQRAQRSVVSEVVRYSVLSDPTASVTPRSVVRIGDDVSVTPLAAGLIGSPIWSLYGGALPSGFQLTPSSGRAYGRASAQGVASGLVFQVLDTKDGATALSNEATIESLRALKVPAVSPPYAKVGASFVWTLPVVPGVYGAASWTVGALPAGLVFDPTRNVIEGTPTAAGSSGVTLTVTDSYDGRTDARSMSLVVNPANAPTPFGISGVPGVYYGASSKAYATPAPLVSGATGTVAWSLASGILPSGFAIDPASGVISGLAPEPVVISGLQLRARDGATANAVTSDVFQISLQTPQPMTITTPAQNLAIVDQPIEIVPQIRSATNPVTVTLRSGTLPGWASLDPATGRISGVAAEIGSTLGVVLQATDADGSVATSNAFSLIVSTQPAPVVSGMSSRYFAQTATPFQTPAPGLSNAQAPVTWSLAEGTLPAWASLDPETGAIAGVPSTTDGAEGLRLRATDGRSISADSATFGISVTRRVMTVALARRDYVAREGAELITDTPAVDGATGLVSYSVAAGVLPSWASFNPQSGRITASSPQPAAALGLVLRATDSGTGQSAVSQPIAIRFVGSSPSVSAQSVYPGVATHAFSAEPKVVNTVGATTWTLSDGQLPAWASLNAATGAITGTPPAAQSVSGLRLKVVDAADHASAFSPVISIDVKPKPAIDVAAGSAYGRAGKVFALQPTVDPAGSYAWSVSPALPSGLAIDAATGRISGVPAATGSFDFVLAARDQANDVGSSPAFNLTFDPQLTASSAPASVSVHPLSPYVSNAPVASNARGSTTWSVGEGSLPAGLLVDPATGVISGTPTSEGPHAFRLRVVDAKDSSFAQTGLLSFDVVPAPDVSVQTVYIARAGFPFAAQPQARNLIGAAVWTLAEGQLPAWATLDEATGRISGTPPAEGSAGPFRLKVADSKAGVAMTAPFSISTTQSFQAVFGAPSYVGRVNRTISTTPPAATGQSGAVTWELSGEALPTGLELNAMTGVISGRVSQNAYVGGLKLRGRDASGATVESAPFVIQILSNPSIEVASATTRVSADFKATPTIGGAIGGRTVSVESGELPAWAIFDRQSGQITGRPNAAGVHVLSLKVVDGEGAVGVSQPFTITVGSGLTVSGVEPSYLGRVGRGFAGPQPTVDGATGATTWTFSGGKPGWMRLTTATGKVTGTPDGPGATTGLRLRARDAADDASAFSSPFTANILGSLNIQNVPSAYVAHVGRPFTAPTPVGANVGGAPAWSIGQGALPSWASLNPATGRVSGVPASEGATTGLKIRLVDSADGEVAQTKDLSISVVPDIDIVDVPTSYTARFGFPFASAPPRALNAVGKPDWSLDRGALPGWAQIDPATGQIYGTPNAVSTTAGLGLRATDASGGDGSSVTFGLSVFNQPAASVAMASFKGRVGTPFTVVPTVQGIAGTPNWTLAAGALHPSLGVSALSGVISGTPTEPYYQALALKVTDQSDGANAETQGFTVDINDALAIAGVKDVYRTRAGGFVTTDAPTLQNNRGDISRSSGSVPNWLSFNIADGVYSGRPPAVTTYTVSLRMVDNYDNAAVDKIIRIESIASLSMASLPQRKARVGAPFTQARPQAFNFLKTQDDLRWSLNGAAMPAGLMLDNVTGRITGTPAASGVYSIIHRATDTDGDITQPAQAFSLTIYDPLAITGATSQAPQQNVSFSSTNYTLAGDSGASAWSATGLPDGLQLTGTGATRRITGTPTSFGSSNATISVTDAFDGATATFQVSITVAPAPILEFHSTSNTLAPRTGAAEGECTAVRLRNASGVTATSITGAVLTNGSDFQICAPAANACSSLAPGASCDIGVRIRGTTAGAVSGTIRALSSNGGSATTNVSGSVSGVVAAGSALYTTAGAHTWTPPRAGTIFKVHVIGGGGGGGGAGASFGGGGGGAGYITVDTRYTDAPVTIVVGAGGNPGNPGGESRAGSVSALGGRGGGSSGGNGSSGGGGTITSQSGSVDGGRNFGAGASGGMPGNGTGVNPITTSRLSIPPYQASGGTGNSCNSPRGGGGGAGFYIDNDGIAAGSGAGTSPNFGVNGAGGAGYGAGGGGGGAVKNGSRCTHSGINPAGTGGVGAAGAVLIEWAAQ